jgi:hypothetical protein
MKWKQSKTAEHVPEATGSHFAGNLITGVRIIQSIHRSRSLRGRFAVDLLPRIIDIVGKWVYGKPIASVAFKQRSIST